MEERVPPAGNDDAKDDPLPKLSSSASPENPSDLYVVQMPRDQVYRVPPPENAQIIAHRSRNLSNQSRCVSKPICWFFLALFLLAATAAAAILIVRATLYSPKSPEFTVTGIKTKHLEQIFHPEKKLTHPPEYDITLRADNPNERLSVTYHGGGKAALIFKSHRIGNGGLPPTIKEEPHAPADIPVVLYGNGVSLPPVIKKGLNDTAAEKTMQLKIEVPMEVNCWLRNKRVDLTVVCDFKVKNSLVNKAKISYQECEANF